MHVKNTLVLKFGLIGLRLRGGMLVVGVIYFDLLARNGFRNVVRTFNYFYVTQQADLTTTIVIVDLENGTFLLFLSKIFKVHVRALLSARMKLEVQSRFSKSMLDMLDE